MEYNNIITSLKKLSRDDRLRLARDLVDNFGQEEELSQLLPSLDENTILAVPGHTLNTKVEGKLIYDHLENYRHEIIEYHSDNNDLKNALPWLIEKIKKIKLYVPECNLIGNKKDEKKKKDHNKIIVSGDERGEDIGFYNNPQLFTHKGVSGIMYMRLDGLTQDVYFDDIFEKLRICNLKSYQAVQLFVLIAGLGKYGYQDEDGRRIGVGVYGKIAYTSPYKKLFESRICTICYQDKIGSRDIGSMELRHAIPAFYEVLP